MTPPVHTPFIAAQWSCQQQGCPVQRAYTAQRPSVIPCSHVGAAGAATEAAWVDKYRPRTFLDLLSDEQINRSVVRALLCVDGEAQQPQPDGRQ